MDIYEIDVSNKKSRPVKMESYDRVKTGCFWCYIVRLVPKKLSQGILIKNNGTHIQSMETENY